MRRALALALVLASPVPALAGGDFNGDGFDDAAIGAPLDPVVVASTGSVSVVYGTMAGFPPSATDGQQVFTAFHFGLVPNYGDDFGAALAIGDFDGDGLADLAIGMPSREVAGSEDAGAVGVVYGAAFGLDPDRWQLFTQATKGVKDDPEPVTGNFGDEFGSALAAGDFDGDGRDDLAIGARGEAVGAEANAGAVHVLRGSKKGLRAKTNQIFTREALLGPGAPSSFFGASFATGDFDGDGRDDLAIGAVQTDIEGQSTGAADVLYGSKKGLTAARHLALDPISLLGAVPGTYFFGDALAAGDFDANGADDLAIGASGTTIGGAQSAGATHVLYGAVGTGLDVGSVETWDELALATGDFGAFDQFGGGLTAGDFDTDGRDDLAIGVLGADVAALTSAGEVIVLRGGASGLTDLAYQIWSQATVGVIGMEEAGDACGGTLASGDFDGDGAQDVLVGCPGEAIGTLEDAGAVLALYGDEGGSGLTADGSEVLARSEAVAGVPADGARLGVAIGD
jgi:hypothetical protein